MKNLKINLDRPPIDSKSIQGHKDFNGLMQNHAIMSKPFYKSPWFMGASGLASISLVAGIVAYNTSADPAPQEVQLDTQAPPELTIPDNKIIAMNTDIISDNATQDLVKETFKYQDYKQNQIDGKTNTLKSENNNGENVISTSDQKIDLDVHSEKHDVVQNENIHSVLLPRIGGKINGSISKEELFDNKGITTESDVSVIHFELHLIDGLGGKVFEEESNQLNDEMKAALKKISSGETIYFENIKGRTGEGDIVRLNPLRYVLMN